VRHCVSVTLRVCVSFVWVFVCVCLRRTVLRFVFAEAECQMFFSRNEQIFLEKGVFKKEKISSRRSVRQSEGLRPEAAARHSGYRCVREMVSVFGKKSGKYFESICLILFFGAGQGDLASSFFLEKHRWRDLRKRD